MSEVNDRLLALERRVDVLQSNEDIRNVLYQYCRAADRCDPELMMLCYHGDAIDDHGFFSGNAVDFVPVVISELRKLELSVHSLSNVVIEIDLDRAFVESHYAVVHRLRHMLGFTDFYHHGRYLDIFERQDGVWKIAKRVIVQDGERWFQTADLSPILRDNPNTPPQGSNKHKADPVYLRFDVGSLIRTRPAVKDLWKGFYRLSLIPLLITRLALIVLRVLRP